MQKRQFQVAHGHEWDFWRFDERRLYLEYRLNDYRIPLQTIGLAAQVLSWIRQVGAKDWAAPSVLLELLKAYREIFSNSRKFSESFQREIATRKDRWDVFCSEMVALIRAKQRDIPSWNRGMEEAYNRFKSEGLLGGET